jgi:hypothetical protein
MAAPPFKCAIETEANAEWFRAPITPVVPNLAEFFAAEITKNTKNCCFAFNLPFLCVLCAPCG